MKAEGSQSRDPSASIPLRRRPVLVAALIQRQRPGEQVTRGDKSPTDGGRKGRQMEDEAADRASCDSRATSQPIAEVALRPDNDGPQSIDPSESSRNLRFG